jgi:hypothetical protein
MTESTAPKNTPTPPPPSTAKPAASPPNVAPEQIRRLIAALDQPGDELYDYAEDELIALGPQAVPALITALSEQGPWLRAYRAAEALGQIGDGRASRPLVTALRHPHSNVRWGVVRALAKVGDSRAILALRRIVRQDRGKTSWGESVASAAQVALNEMQGRSAMLRLSDPIKIALLVAVALFALWFASDRVQAFYAAVDDPSNTAAWGKAVTPILPTDVPESDNPEEDLGDEAIDTTPTPTLAITTTPTVTLAVVTAEITASSANVRSAPNTNNDPIGRLVSGDSIEIIEQSGEWYRIQLPNGTGTGWIATSVVGPPSAPVPTARPN